MRPHLLRLLKPRHILMIALGSAIGTGLFFGAGESIKLAGPSILLSYTIGGIIMYIVIRALGEMTVYEPNVGSFSFYAYKYINQYAGFMAGWNYWFNYIIVSMLELTATTMFLDYWIPISKYHWLIALGILTFFGLINLMNVKFFGEFEFWFTGIKVTTIIILIIIGLYLIFTNQSTDTGDIHSNIKNLWQYGGFFTGGFHGFILSFVVVIFAFGGTELVGIAAGESDNPKKTIPIAINGIIIRISVFYVLVLAIIMCLYPWDKIDNSISPFVDVFNKVGIPKAAALMNLVAIAAALSSFNSGIYGTARMLFNLARQGNAPKYFIKLTSGGAPYLATIFSISCIFITVILNYFYPKQIFYILLALATTAAMINWITILIAQICFRWQVDRQNIFYKMPLYPFSSIVAIGFFIFVLITMLRMPTMSLAVYIMPLWILILSILYIVKIKAKN